MKSGDFELVCLPVTSFGQVSLRLLSPSAVHQTWSPPLHEVRMARMRSSAQRRCEHSHCHAPYLVKLLWQRDFFGIYDRLISMLW